MLHTNSVMTRLTIFTIVVSLTPFPCLAIVQGDAELLKTVALKNKANLESLLTWKGEAFEERTSTRGDWYDYMRKNKFTFAYDQLQNAVRWNQEPQEYRYTNHGESRTDATAIYNAAMFKDRSYWKYKGSRHPSADKASYALVIDDPIVAKGMKNHFLDPRDFLADPSGKTIHDRLMSIYNRANDPKWLEWRVTRAGDLVTLQASRNDTVTKKVYDLSAGGTMVEYYNKSPTAVNTHEYSYEEKSGVWILKSYKRTNVTHGENGEVSNSTRTINWSNSVVNVPFEEDEFTVAKLGIKPGDRVFDNKIGLSYRYGGTTESQAMSVLDTANTPIETVFTENGGAGGVDEDANEVVALVQEQDSNEVGTVPRKPILSETTPASLDTDGSRSYFYAIVAAVVIALAATAYVLTRRSGKE